MCEIIYTESCNKSNADHTNITINLIKFIIMEENQPNTGKYAFNFGALTGGIGVIFAIMLYTMDMHYEQGFTTQIVQTLILVFGIVLGIMQFKKSNNGFLVLSQALKVAAGVALIAGIIGLIWYFIFSNIIEPDFIEKSFEIGKAKAMADNPELTEEQMQQGFEMQKKFAWVFYPVGLIINVIIGLVVGLIAGLVMKKEEPAY